MHTSKRILSFLCSFTVFFLTSVLYFAKLLYNTVKSNATRILKDFDTFLCTTKQSLIFLGIFSVIMNYFLEAALRRSFTEPLSLAIKSPHVFLLGVLIVFAAFSLMYLFRRRAFVFTLVTLVWVIITYVSYFLMCQRTTPFNSSDFRVLKSAFDIIPVYLSNFDIFLLSVAIIAMIALLTAVFIKCKKTRGILSPSSLSALIVCGITFFSVIFYSSAVVKSDRFDNLPNKYREHGFSFCFLYSIIDNGISKPTNYSKATFNEHRETIVSGTEPIEKPEIQKISHSKDITERVYEQVIKEYSSLPDYPFYNFTFEQSEKLISHLKEKHEQMPVNPSDGTHIHDFPDDFDRPNIIFLQLESFYDVNNIMGYQYSSEPHPIYSMLKEELPGGKLTVPSIGAGTANTEFEIITGMDVSFFGIAEYPYLSVLQNQTCESMAYNAKAYGYSAHAIHNHKGTFYDRNKVFPNLGFDTFTSIENTPKVIRNRRNWGKDAMLIEPILASLDSTEGQDLIYTVSVQPHGRYPTESKYNKILQGEEPKIKVYGNEDNPENPGFEYYVNELNEVDTFLGNLILELGYRNEPTVLVFYGDHLPAFSVQKSWELKEGDCYQTDYIIWNNCGLDYSDAKDLTTFQLSSYIFSKLGIDSGDFNRLNRLYLENSTDDYAHLRHIYQYATLYDNTLKNSSSTLAIPQYERVNTKYGVTSTTILGGYTIDGSTYISGEHFNEFSKICVNGEVYDTEFINEGLLKTEEEPVADDIISIVQQAANHTILGESENHLTYTNLMVVPDELKTQYLDYLIPSEDEFTRISDNVLEDATLEFVTGAEEQQMIQQDIHKPQQEAEVTTEDTLTQQ